MRALSFEGFYTYLLYQDLESVVPYNLGEGTSAVTVVGRDCIRAGPLIASALTERRSRSSISEAVRSFICTAARHLVLAGPTTYEIDYRFPKGSTPTAAPFAFRLELVTPGTLSYRGTTPIQYVPDAVGGQRDRNGLTYVELDAATLVTFSLDHQMEASVRRMVTFLRCANLQQGADAALVEQSMREATPYDFSAHQREKGELFASVTAPVGWNVRDLFKEDHLEPYNVWRQLRFLEFKVRVRDRVMMQLNTTVRDVGEQLGFEATIELSGLPTIADVEAAKDDLRTGRRGLGDLSLSAL